MIGGLMGTGKSTLAQHIAEETGFTVLNSDVIRKTLAGISLEEHRYEEFDAGIYSAGYSTRTYAELLRQARLQLQAGNSVILDASFGKRKERAKVRDLAARNNARFLAVECILSQEEARQRLQRRMEQKSVSDGRWELFMKQKEDFDTITEFPASEFVRINTAGNVADMAIPALERL
jgi:predicted kinase